MTEHIILPSSASIAVYVRRHSRARRFILRYHPAKAHATLTIPKRASLKQAQAFAQERAQWLSEQQAQFTPAVALQPGVTLPLLEVPTVFTRGQRTRGGAMAMGEHHIEIACLPESFGRRVRMVVAAQLQEYLTPIVAAYAAQCEVKIPQVKITNPSSYWGLCSPRGIVSFSWRLAFAPRWVVDYIAAHEVAHLRHANHSPRFWQCVHQLHPHTEQARRWMREHGNSLYLFG